MVPVKRGISDDNYVEIVEGLHEGDEVVSGSSRRSTASWKTARRWPSTPRWRGRRRQKQLTPRVWVSLIAFKTSPGSPNGHGNHPCFAGHFPGGGTRGICGHHGTVRVGEINVDSRVFNPPDTCTSGYYELNGTGVLANWMTINWRKYATGRSALFFRPSTWWPLANALRNVELPLIYAWRVPSEERKQIASGPRLESVGLGDRHARTNPTKCPGASASGWPLRGRWSIRPRSSWPMNRRATWIPRPATKSWRCCGRSDKGNTIFVVTHEEGSGAARPAHRAAAGRADFR